MNIDEKIKRELENEASEIDQILLDDQGLFDMVRASFTGGMRRWVILMNVIIMLVSAVMVWTGYRFFTSSITDDYIFWGVCLLISAHAQIAMKQWIFMEMNRSSLMREIKRVEVAVAKLASNKS